MTTAAQMYTAVIRGARRAPKKAVETFDVAVIGSSVCGAMLAAVLGEAGISAAIVGDNRFSGKRGGFDMAFSVSKPAGCPTERSAGAFLKIVSSGGKTIDVLKDGKPLSFFSIPKLEAYFTDKAARARVRTYSGGASALYQENGCWVVRTPNATIKSRIAVGAGGWDSMVRKTVGAGFNEKDLHFAVGCSGRANGENGVRINLFKGGRFCRVINCGSNASVTVYGPAADMVTPKLIFDRVIKSGMAAVRSVFSYRTTFVPSPSSTEFYSLPCSGKNWILLGETAGHVHPVSGESLRYALRGARLAARAIECGEPRVFDGLWRADYGRELEAALNLKNKINRWTKLTDWTFGAASKSPRLRNVISGRLFI